MSQATLVLHLFMVGCLLILSLSVRSKQKLSNFQIIPVMLGILVVRQVLLFFIGPSTVILSMDFILATMALLWFLSFWQKTTRLVYWLTATLNTVLFIVLAIATEALDNVQSNLLIVPVIAQMFVVLNLVRRHPGKDIGSFRYSSFWIIAGFVAKVLLRQLAGDSLDIHLNYDVLTIIAGVFGAIIAHDKGITRNEIDHIARLDDTIELITSTLHNFADIFTEEGSSEEMYQSILHMGLTSVGAHSGTLLLVENAAEGVLKVQANEGKVPLFRSTNEGDKLFSMDESYKVTHPLLTDAFAKGSSVYIPNVYQDPRCDDIPFSVHNIGSVLIVPLTTRQKVYGILILIKVEGAPIITLSEQRHLDYYVEYASVSIHMIRNYHEHREKRRASSEVELMGEIQRILKPNIKQASVENLSVDVYFKAVGEGHSDYFDFIKSPDGRMNYIVADIAGRGIIASMVMAIIRSTFHLIAGADKEAGSVLTWINRAITRRIRLDRYAAVTYLSYDPKTRTVSFASAAGSPIIHYHAESGNCELINNHSAPLGIDGGASFDTQKIQLVLGDILAVSSDGIIEALNEKGSAFGTDSIVNRLQKSASLSVSDLAGKVKSDVEYFISDSVQRDDHTLMLFKAR